jgi:HSP20 family molecular chaperone IbpA
MDEKKDIKTEETAVQPARAPDTGTTYVPDVDIVENSEHITLLADMPGVGQDSVGVTVENNVLTVEGTANTDRPAGYDLVGQEYGVGRYRRDFTLPPEADVEGIKGRIRHGVLEVTVPKREEVKTRKVEIES